MTDECVFMYFLSVAPSTAIIIILSFLEQKRKGLTAGLTTNTGIVKRALKVVSLP